MKFEIQREVLLKPLQLVCGVVERRQTLPILANILLTITKDKLKLTATDLEVEMNCQADMKSTETGTLTLPARKFMDICRALPEQQKLELDFSEGERAVIRSGKSRFVLSTLPAAEFPNIELGKDLTTFSMSQDLFKQALERTGFAMAQQDVRYYLNGMLFEINSGGVRFVATDGHRLALCDVATEKKIKENQHIIVPRKGVNELLRLLSEAEKTANIKLGSNHIQVSIDDMSFTSKLIDGKFPDYQNVVPTGGDKEIVCNRDILKQALNRVSILSNEKYRGVRLQFSNGRLGVFAHNPEQEEAEEELSIDYKGDDLEIGFNVTYLLDAIAACRSDQVKLLLTDSNSCCLIQDVGDQNCKYVVMPMRL